MAFQTCKPGQSHYEAIITAWLGLAYLGPAWLGSWPEAGPSTALLMSDMHTEYPKPYLPLSRQPTQPADDPSWSKPKPKFGQPTAIPPCNEPLLCTLTNFGVAIITPCPSEFSTSDLKLMLGTLNIEQVKHAIVEDCWYPTSGHLKVSYSFTGSFVL